MVVKRIRNGRVRDLLLSATLHAFWELAPAGNLGKVNRSYSVQFVGVKIGRHRRRGMQSSAMGRLGLRITGRHYDTGGRRVQAPYFLQAATGRRKGVSHTEARW